MTQVDVHTNGFIGASATPAKVDADRPEGEPNKGSPSNATTPDMATSFERVQGTGVPTAATRANDNLILAEQLARAGNFRAARPLVDRVFAALPRDRRLEKQELDFALKYKGNDPEGALAEVSAKGAAAFDADPARNGGFRVAQINEMRERGKAVLQRCDVLQLEARIKAAASEPLESDPSDRGETANQFACAARHLIEAGEQLKISPEARKLAQDTYAARRKAYLAIKIAILDAATTVGNSEGLVAVGWDRMHYAINARGVVMAAASGQDSLAEGKPMPPSEDARRATQAFVDMLTNTRTQGVEDWKAIASKVKAAMDTDIKEAFRLVRGDLSLAHGVLDMGHRVLKRLPEMAPLTIEEAEIEIDVTRRALEARSERASELGVVERDANFVCGAIVRDPQGTAPADLTRCAELAKQADELGNAIAAARGTLPPEKA